MSAFLCAVRPAGWLAISAAAQRVLGKLPAGLVRFLVVGMGGLCVDLALLWLVERLGAGHAVARAVSLSVATLVTWALNRQFTFGESGEDPSFEFGRYAFVALLAQSVNYVVFLGACAAFPELNHALAALIGAIAAAGFSYTGQRFFTFAPRSARHTVE